MISRTIAAHAFCAVVLATLAGCDAVDFASDGQHGPKVVEMAMFEAGYGTHWHKKMAALYNRDYAPHGVQVRIWGDQRSDEICKPRILRGDPPDLLHTAGLPIWALVAADKLVPYDDILDKPAFGSDRTWRECFIPGTLDTFSSNGHVYGIPYAFGAWGCWYNARLFREHGWTVPKTWSEFDALCTKIRAAGIEPIAFQGKYPTYAWATLVTLAQRCGGVVAVNRINAVEPGAYTHPDFVQAAHLLQDMALRHFQHGAMAMTHTESQLQFVNDKAALIFCGVWLENEQKTTTPPDFEMRCFNIPAVEGGKGNPDAFLGEGAEHIYAPADAEHPREGQDFVRFLVSPSNAEDLARTISVISPLKGATPRDAVSPALASILDMMDRAPGIFFTRVVMLLLRWNNEDLVSGLDALLSGRVTPEEFCQRLEAGAQRDRNNPDVIIPPCVPFDPHQFGEAE